MKDQGALRASTSGPQRPLSSGRRTAVATAAGDVVGSCLLVVAVVFGVGSPVERPATVYLNVKPAGAAPLVRLGLQAFRRRKELRASQVSTNPKRSAGRAAARCSGWA